MSNLVFAITSTSDICSIIQRNLDKKYKVKIFRDIQSAISAVFDEFPSLIIVELNQADDALSKIINDIKTDTIFGQIVVVCIIPDDLYFSTWNVLLADDYIRRTDVEKDLNFRIELSILRAQRIVELNPLTRLPGNISIQKQITSRIEKKVKFAVAYADIDHFKPYNDKYGFSQGDEVIMMLGRLIFNMVKNDQPFDSFVGHIGGDDFIYIMDIERIENTSRKIIEQFDRIVPVFYSQTDREKGFIESKDRRGKTKRFNIITLSICATHNKNKSFQHYGEISTILAEIKQYAKSFKGSYFIIDRRT